MTYYRIDDVKVEDNVLTIEDDVRIEDNVMVE